ncbi:hypothetical protein AB0F72_05340 [Actinoplanes sp. NPDC023936]|uniref:hypothetical protein n=1 Tax=Actinoplanes sp. NPDC023936 TaxID=3154910 RepID=UPI0033D7C724
MSDPQPTPPYMCIGMVLDRLRDADALDAVCRKLVELGAGYSGRVWLGPSDPGPFSWVTDLPLLAATLPSSRPDMRPYRVWMEVGGLGHLWVGFGHGDRRGGHSVEVMLSAGPYGDPEESWDDEDREEAPRYLHELGKLFRRLCIDLDPIYAAVDDVNPTVTPSELLEGALSLPSDFYVSRRLGPVLDEVVSLFPASLTSAAPTGSFVTHWLRVGGYTKSSPEALRSASVAVGRGVEGIGWAERRAEDTFRHDQRAGRAGRQ